MMMCGSGGYRESEKEGVDGGGASCFLRVWRWARSPTLLLCVIQAVLHSASKPPWGSLAVPATLCEKGEDSISTRGVSSSRRARAGARGGSGVPKG